MSGASFAAATQTSGLLKGLLKGHSKAENVKFVLEHEAELQKPKQEIKGLQKWQRPVGGCRGGRKR